MTSEQRFMSMYWPATEPMLQDIRDHARACRLRADAGDAPWGRLAAFTADMTRRSLPRFEEVDEYVMRHHVVLSDKQRHGTTAALCDLLHDLIMEGV
jgi:hypothetical protein